MASDPPPTAIEDLESDLLDTPAAGPAAMRGSVVRVLGYLFGVLLSLISVPLLIRHLGLPEYGHYVLVIAIVTIVQGVTDIGLGQIGVREYSTRSPSERDHLMRNLLGVRIVLTSLGVLLGVAFAAAVGYAHAVVFGTLLAGAGMVLTVAQGTYSVPLAAQLRLGWVTGLELLRQVLSVSGIVVLVVVGANLLPFLAISVPAALVALLATLVLVRGSMPLRPLFEREEWILLLRAVLPFAAAAVIATLYLRITVVLTSLLASELQSGYYATSFTVIAVLTAIPALTVGSALPILARAARDDRERLAYVIERLVQTTLIVGAGLALTLGLGAAFVVKVLANESAGPAVVVLQIQSVAILIQFVGSGWQYGLLALHRHRSLLLMSALGLLVSVTLTLTLVPAIEARGAAIAYAGGELFVGAFALFSLQRGRPDLRPSLALPLKVLLAAALAASVLAVPGLSSLARAIIAGVLYVVLLLAFRAVPAEIRDLLPGRPAAKGG